MGTSLVVVLGQDLSLCCSGVSRFWGSRLRVGWRQPDLGHRRCGIWCFPTLTIGTCMGSSRSHSRGWWYRCTLWAWRHGQLWRPPAVGSRLYSAYRGTYSWRLSVGGCCPAPLCPPSGSSCGCLVCWCAWHWLSQTAHLLMTTWMTPWRHWRSAHNINLFCPPLLFSAHLLQWQFRKMRLIN